MAYTPGTFQGLTQTEYDTLNTDYAQAFAPWASQFSAIPAGNGTFYQFTGNQREYLEFLLENDIDEETFGLHMFLFIYSTNEVIDL